MNEREHIFGTDIQLVPRAGGLDLVPNSQGDLSKAVGNDNIVQALTLRLQVRRGELERLGWSNFGSRIHELIGEPNNTRTHVKLMAFARDALQRDRRVLEILATNTQVIERGSVRLIVDIQLIEQQQPLNLIFDLNLEGGSR